MNLRGSRHADDGRTEVIDEPVFLTSAIRSPADPQTLIVRRAGMAVVFALRVSPPQRKLLDRLWSMLGAGVGPASVRRETA